MSGFLQSIPTRALGPRRSSLGLRLCSPPRPLLIGRAFFDTYRFVQRLEGEGIPRDAAEAVMSSLGEVLGECLSSVEKASVSRADYENGTHIQRLEVQGLRSEMQLMEKNEVAMIKQEIGRLGRETDKLSLQMGEDLRRAQADVRLELSLEKVRNSATPGN